MVTREELGRMESVGRGVDWSMGDEIQIIFVLSNPLFFTFLETVAANPIRFS